MSVGSTVMRQASLLTAMEIPQELFGHLVFSLAVEIAAESVDNIRKVYNELSGLLLSSKNPVAKPSPS